MYSTKYIAQSFVKQYYEILSTKPEELYKFYFSQASFLHTETPVVEDSVTGVEAIRNKVKGLNLLGAKIDISKGHVDFQEFDVNRVLVVVVGVFTAAGQSPKQFTQTFVLAGQNNNYFVSNSVFRLLSEEPVKVEVPVAVVEPVVPQSAPVVEVAPVAAPEPVVPEVEETVVVEEPVVVEEVQEVVVEEVVEVVEEVVEAEVAKEEEEVVEVVAAEEEAAPAATEEVAAVEETEVEAEVAPVSETNNGAPKSYLDIVKKIAAASQPVKETPVTNGYRTFKTKAVVTPQPATSPAPATSGESTPVVETTKFKYTHNYHDINKATGQQLYSVYVSNLPEPITENELQQAFTQFGTVVQVDITRGKKYAFVKFEQITSMQAALDHELPVEVNGTVLRIEERTKSTNTGKDKDGMKDKKPFRKFVKDGNNKEGTGAGAGEFKDKKKDFVKDKHRNNNNNNNNNNKEFKKQDNKEFKKEVKSSEGEVSK